MQHDVSAVYSSPGASLTGVLATERLRLSMQAAPFTDAIDVMDPVALPTVDVSGPINRMRQEVDAVFASRDVMSSTLLSWLRQDVLDLSALFSVAAGIERVRVRLQVVEDDMCRKFHVDNVAFRLVTTYRGPGTEWMAPCTVADATKGKPLPPNAIRRMKRGTVAVMRGGKNATPDRPGVLHRSPPIAGTGVTRLFLAINDVDGFVGIGGMSP